MAADPGDCGTTPEYETAEPYTLEGQCKRYGLPVSFNILMRHLYANHDLTIATHKTTIALLMMRLDHIEMEMVRANKDYEDSRAGVISDWRRAVYWVPSISQLPPMSDR